VTLYEHQRQILLFQTDVKIRDCGLWSRSLDSSFM